MNKKKMKECEYLIAAKKITYYLTPAELDFNPLYMNLSDKSKKLYSILISRHSLAEKMGLLDDKGMPYVLFPQDDIAELFHVSVRTTTTLIDQLCGVGLIQKRKVGYGNYDIIYVKNILEEERSTLKNEKISNEESVSDACKRIEPCYNSSALNEKKRL